jgi:hypothetical protein
MPKTGLTSNHLSSLLFGDIGISFMIIDGKFLLESYLGLKEF